MVRRSDCHKLTPVGCAVWRGLEDHSCVLVVMFPPLFGTRAVKTPTLDITMGLTASSVITFRLLLKSLAKWQPLVFELCV